MTMFGNATDVNEPSRELTREELDRIAGGTIGEAIKQGVLRRYKP